MKHLFFIIVLLSQGRTNQVDVEFMYPSLDAALIDVWTDSKSKDPIKLSHSISSLSTTWEQQKKDIIEEYVPHFDIPYLAKDVDQIMASLEKYQREKNYRQIEQYAEHILWEFRSIRNCVQAELYPLDQLWYAYDYNEEIKLIVENPMMELYEWNEFIAIYDKFKCQFQTYDLMTDQELTSHFPDLDQKKHRENIRSVYICIEKLEKALQTAYQSNFVSPCDEIGIALMDLIKQYRTPTYL